jgi:putative ABC transport system ATP-binding protein
VRLVPTNKTVRRALAEVPDVGAADVAGAPLDFGVPAATNEPFAWFDALDLCSPVHALVAATKIAAPIRSRRPATRFPIIWPIMLVARDLSKEYRSGENRLAVLRDVSFSIPQGAFVAIVGPSGSGKTTLLGLLAGLDTPTRGRVILDDADLTGMDEDQRAQLRGEKVGFVFQSFQLISTLTALENVQVPLELRGDRGAADRARDLLTRVGLGDRLDHFPTQLSGGEQQRVAIARALVNDPFVLLADEPTGNLDTRSGADVMALLSRLNAERGVAVVVVTHDPEVAAHARRRIDVRDGLIERDTGVDEQPAP